jgi:AcrR family transcriptional regulator
MPTSKLLPFQRARRPAQIEERKEAILLTALHLFQKNGLENVSLTDIAREVGLAKSNIYRYFESREHIYLIVLQRLASQFEQRLYLPLEKLKGRGNVAKVAAIVTEAYIDSPEYGELVTVVNSVLERRLTPRLVIDFRSVFLDRRKRLAAVLASALPGTTAEKILPFTLHIFLHVPGLWTFCYPRPDSQKLLNESKYRHLKLDFRREMTLFLQALLKEALISNGRSRDGV